MNIDKLNKRNRRARRNLALKLVLEKEFLPSLRRYFDDIRRLAMRNFRDTNIPPDQTLFENKTQNLLRLHYRRVVKAFKNEMRLFISNGKKSDATTQENDLTDKIMAIFILTQSDARANQINKTNLKNINDSFIEAQRELIADERPITPAETEKIANRKLKDKFKGREDTIALTETQFVAEKTKRVEASVLSRARNGDIDIVSAANGTITAAPDLTKEWVAILDELTRDSHAQADGQIVTANDPFVVQGELLMEPGDTSLGASASNTIGCRCSALYSLGGVTLFS